MDLLDSRVGRTSGNMITKGTKDKPVQPQTEGENNWYLLFIMNQESESSRQDLYMSVGVMKD